VNEWERGCPFGPMDGCLQGREFYCKGSRECYWFCWTNCPFKCIYDERSAAVTQKFSFWSVDWQLPLLETNHRDDKTDHCCIVLWGWTALVKEIQFGLHFSSFPYPMIKIFNSNLIQQNKGIKIYLFIKITVLQGLSYFCLVREIITKPLKQNEFEVKQHFCSNNGQTSIA